ncbi:hypothetical protein GCM10007047_17750 [Cerasicoccus arenae]|uniref:Uncharacterized protein n=2 Tax=Cerasicoccus arenae TaxID=424488 RepID=A0A8J3DBQ7_9BACT|nr:hypothetical protein GCM10007047_17750 [Cerasicoccus arenae]
MAHHIHNLLFFCGREDLFSWASCAIVEAEFYRVNDIQGPDTLFLRGEIDGGVRFRLGLTNSCDDDDLSVEELEFDDASVIIHPNTEIIIRHRSGVVESLPLPKDFPLVSNMRRYLAYFNGDIDRPTTLLQDCRPVVGLNALAFQACNRIHHLSDDFVNQLPGATSMDYVNYIPGIVEMLRDFVDCGLFPSETDCPWGQPGGRATSGDCAELPERIKLLLSETDPECADLISV